MAQIWSTGPAHIYIGVPSGRNFANVPQPPPAPIEVVTQGSNLPFPNPMDAHQRSANAEFLITAAGGIGGIAGAAANAAAAAASRGPTPPPVKTLVPFRCVYLGRAEKAPVIDVEEVTAPFYSDTSGPGIPYDRLYQGQVGMIEAMLTEWNESARRFLVNMPVRSATGRFYGNGSTDIVDIGAGMGLNRLGFPVWILFPNAGAGHYTGMPGGYRFWYCTRKSVQTLPGSTAERIHIVLDANRAFGRSHSNPLNSSPVNRNLAYPEFFMNEPATLYDYDVSDAVAAGVN